MWCDLWKDADNYPAAVQALQTIRAALQRAAA